MLKGKQVYTMDGALVEFDHAHDGQAYVRPIQTIVYQTQYGDDFEEEEIQEAADHLISVPLDKLTTKPPVAALDAEIAEKQNELKALARQVSTIQAQAAKVHQKLDSELANAKQRLEDWKEKHVVFEQLGRLLDGEDMFVLREETYYGTPTADAPSIIDTDDIDVLRLKHTRRNNSSAWFVKEGRSFDYEIRFFNTEEERANRISELFSNLCKEFRKKPNYGSQYSGYSSRLDYEALERWCLKHSHLSIPQDIVDGKAAADETLKEAKKARLKAQLDELEG